MPRNSDFFSLRQAKKVSFGAGQSVLCWAGRPSHKKTSRILSFGPSLCNVLASAQTLFPNVYFLQISILGGNMNINVTLRLVGISLKRQNYPPIHIEEGCNLFRLNSLYLQTVMSIGLRSHICHVS